MTITRRSLIGAILASASAPALVRAGSIMRINPAIVLPPEWTADAIGGYFVPTEFGRMVETTWDMKNGMVFFRERIVPEHEWRLTSSV